MIKNFVRFGDLFDYENKSKIKAGDGLQTGKYPFYTSSNELSKYLNEYSFDKTSLIFGTGGNASIHYTNVPFSVSTDCVVAIPMDESKICAKFVFYYLSGNINLLEEGFKGAGLKHISKAYINEIQIPLPPLATQKRIAEILDAADALRLKDQELLKKYDELAQVIFIDMFGDPVKNDKGWDVKTIRSIGLRISDGPFGSNLKTEHYSKEGVRVIRLKNIGINSFNDEDSAFVNINHYENVLKKYTCIPGDILIGTLGEPNLRACIFPDHIEKAVNKADCVMLRLDPEICSQNYVAYLLNSPSFVESVASKLHGQTRTRISMGQVANLLINIPPKSLQDKFSDLIVNIKMQNDKRTLQLINSSTLFNSLIQKAFKGELVS